MAYLGDQTRQPQRPFVVILGGAKVSDKIQVIDALLDKADTIIIGGAMAYTFALAQGRTVGDSLSEHDQIDTARAALKKAAAKGVEFLLPVDNLAVSKLDFSAGTVGDQRIFEGNIEPGWEGVDIGLRVSLYFKKLYAKQKQSCGMALWVFLRLRPVIQGLLRSHKQLLSHRHAL